MFDDPAQPGERRVLTVKQLNEAIGAALLEAFPDALWVRGEVQRLPHDAASRRHVYFELHDGGKQGAVSHQIPAAILGWDRDRYRLGRFLDGSDPSFRLQDKLEVCLQCRVDFYAPYGKVSLKVIGVDPEYSLGKLEAQRRRVLAWLEAQGLTGLNATRPWPALPLRLGLITSAGSAAEQDVLSGLRASGYPFSVLRADCRMQGEQTAPQVIAALQRLAAEAVDVIVIARGGGSRADLSWFDQQDICAAVARCPLPVVSAIGHEVDTSLVDLCAHTRCKTPTAAAALLVEQVRAWDRRVEEAARRVGAGALVGLAAARRRFDGVRRLGVVAARSVREWERRHHALVTTLAARTGRAVARCQQRLQGLSGEVAHGARALVAASRGRPDYLARELGREVRRALDRAGQRAAGPARAIQPAARRLQERGDQRLQLLAARVAGLDPQRQLERGFTLTLDGQGRLLRRAGEVVPGQALRTRFADGEVISKADGPESKPGRRAGSRGGNRGPEEDAGQQALF